MAILSNGKFYGFLCSVKETGQKLANGVKEYVEDFMSGFAGHGWKLWEYMTGKWKLEIDTIVVRETMIIFEMLISKIRAIIGAQTISQGHGKVKSARISDDGTEYLIVLEDEDMSVVAHDFVRCQTFVGDKTKLYHVEVDSVDVETRTLHVLLSEFDKDESGNILCSPAAGDELVQFGNSQNKTLQSAIYIHADETGQPAIDVMFDLNSKNWDGKVKVRVGGDIPGSGGLKGFYCVNGMIKGVDSKGNAAYCIYPDGTAELGCGSALFKPDKSGHIAGGAIEWIWDESNQKCVCTMKDVVLTWDNLADDAKENLKGEPGKDGTDGLSIVWKGDSSIPPSSPEKNWAYRDTDNGRVYIYNGLAWALMVADGNDGTDGTDGKDGMRVYITYNDSKEEPDRPVGDGTKDGWHTNSTASVVWISQKVSESADSGGWGDPIRVKGEPGKDANLLPWIEEWDNNKTQIGSESIISPKMFAGTNTGTSANPTLTGVAIGRGVITINGVEKTGLFGLKNGKLTFEIDAETGDAAFRGKIETQTSGSRIVIDPVTNSLKMYNTNDWAVFSLSFIGDSYNAYPQFVINGVENGEYSPGIVMTGRKIEGSLYYSKGSGLNADTKWKIDEDGISHFKDTQGFSLTVDLDQTYLPGMTSLHLTRFAPGFLPGYSTAKNGEVYVTSDGTLKIKGYSVES